MTQPGTSGTAGPTLERLALIARGFGEGDHEAAAEGKAVVGGWAVAQLFAGGDAQLHQGDGDGVGAGEGVGGGGGDGADGQGARGVEGGDGGEEVVEATVCGGGFFVAGVGFEGPFRRAGPFQRLVISRPAAARLLASECRSGRHESYYVARSTLSEARVTRLKRVPRRQLPSTWSS